MSLINHQLAFRPLLGGIEIYVPRVNEVGTLGLLAQDVGGGDDRWLVSCYHVLIGGPGTLPVAGEGVRQPAAASSPTAFVDAFRADAALDCAAARIDSGIETAAEILGIGATGIPTDPEIGMHVIKSGAASGVTEGVIEDINGDDVTIGLPPGFPPEYDLSLPGDSGSIWLSRKGHQPVALHIRSGLGTRKTVMAKRVLPVLHVLGLSIEG